VESHCRALTGFDSLASMNVVGTDKYTAAVNRAWSGLRIGVVKEGFVAIAVRGGMSTHPWCGGPQIFPPSGEQTVDDIIHPVAPAGPAIWTLRI